MRWGETGWVYQTKAGSNHWHGESTLSVAPPEPTSSGRSTLFDDPEFQAMQEKMTQQWDICKADAKVIGCKPERVQQFKAVHKIKQDRPLSVDAQQLLREELEADERAAKGEATALDARLKRLQELATPERLEAMHRGISKAKCYPSDSFVNGGIPQEYASEYILEDAAREYLASGLEYVGLKRQVKVTSKLIKTLQALVPTAASYPLETRFNRQQAVLWGAILRLSVLDGEPPTTGCRRDFLDWCGFSVIERDQGQKARQAWRDVAQTVSGKPTSTPLDRKVLDLPEQGELTSASIKAAYKAAAKKAHPDLGGSAEQMTRLNEAKERLMLTVAA
jgi:hypothetical protein